MGDVEAGAAAAGEERAVRAGIVADVKQPGADIPARHHAQIPGGVRAHRQGLGNHQLRSAAGDKHAAGAQVSVKEISRFGIGRAVSRHRQAGAAADEVADAGLLRGVDSAPLGHGQTRRTRFADQQLAGRGQFRAGAGHEHGPGGSGQNRDVEVAASDAGAGGNGEVPGAVSAHEHVRLIVPQRAAAGDDCAPRAGIGDHAEDIAHARAPGDVQTSAAIVANVDVAACYVDLATAGHVKRALAPIPQVHVAAGRPHRI